MLAVPAKYLWSLAATLLCVGVATAQPPAPPVDFALVNELFVGQSEQPYSVHRIVFRSFAEGNRCYDRDSSEPSRITIFDFVDGLVHLIDRREAWMTSLAMSDIEEETARFDADTTDVQIRVRLGIDADVRRNEDRFASRFGDVAYVVTTEPASDWGGARTVGQFIDAACRLNFVRGFGLPPFARLRLNHEIVRAGRVATATQVTLHRSGETIRMQTRREPATAADMAWVDEVESLRSLCTPITFEAFSQPRLAADSGARR